MHRPAGELGDLVHVFLDGGREGGILVVGGFAALEIDIRVLRGHLGIRGFRTQSAGAETFDILHVDQSLDLIVVKQLDFLVFVGGAESVEERDERNFAFEGCQMGNDRQVVGFLDAGGAGHGETGRAAGHHVGVVAEDRKGLGREGAGGNMEHGREHFAGDLVHVGDHQQQALAGRVGDGQGACAQGAVGRAGGAGFGLHFHDPEGFPEHVLHSLAGPGIGVLTHGRGRGDGVEGGDFAERVSDVTGGMIAVDGLHFFTHLILLLRVWKCFLTTREKTILFHNIHRGGRIFKSTSGKRLFQTCSFLARVNWSSVTTVS